MLPRILSRLGLMGWLPEPSRFGARLGAFAEGEARFRFTPGRNAALSAETAQAGDERGGCITDEDLVWPGKTTTVCVRNDEPVVYRFQMTITDLDPSYYAYRPPVGGVCRPDGSVLLQPGEEAAFEVCFSAPPFPDTAPARTFSFVISSFDPRRSQDPGEIIGDLPARWVRLPGAGDLQITAPPGEILLRPWRRRARFPLRLHNGSDLPPRVQLRVLRAPTREALAEKAESVGTLSRSLEPHTGGTWHCLLPPSGGRDSYFVMVTGTAYFAPNVQRALMLPQPVSVQHVPWLHPGRDWAFLAAMLMALAWLAWGIPVRKRPIVSVSLNFAGLEKGQVPEDARLKDLRSQLILLDDEGREAAGQASVQGVPKGGRLEFILPPRWYGFRWVFGDHIEWNGASRPLRYFHLAVTPKEGKQSLFKKYDLDELAPQGNAGSLAFSVSNAPRVFGDWTTDVAVIAPRNKGVAVCIGVADWGSLTAAMPGQVTVKYALGGQAQERRTFALKRDARGRIKPFPLDLSDRVDPGSPVDFTVYAEAGGRASNPATLAVRHQDKPYQVALVFPREKPPPKPMATPPAAPAPQVTPAKPAPPVIVPQVTPAKPAPPTPAVSKPPAPPAVPPRKPGLRTANDLRKLARAWSRKYQEDRDRADYYARQGDRVQAEAFAVNARDDQEHAEKYRHGIRLLQRQRAARGRPGAGILP